MAAFNVDDMWKMYTLGTDRGIECVRDEEFAEEFLESGPLPSPAANAKAQATGIDFMDALRQVQDEKMKIKAAKAGK